MRKGLFSYLVKFCWLADGLKLQVEEDKLNGGIKSVGDVLLLFAKISASFGVGFIDRGLLATLPGVILGSSSMVFI